MYQIKVGSRLERCYMRLIYRFHGAVSFEGLVGRGERGVCIIKVVGEIQGVRMDKNVERLLS